MKSRRRISELDINVACRLLDAWSNKLSWERFLSQLSVELGYQYTRQAMRRHTRVTASYERAKNRLKESTERARTDAGRSKRSTLGNGDSALAVAYDKIEVLKNTIDRLEHENRDLLVRFVTWQYNAALRGLSEAELDRSIPRHSGRK